MTDPVLDELRAIRKDVAGYGCLVCILCILLTLMSIAIVALLTDPPKPPQSRPAAEANP